MYLSQGTRSSIINANITRIRRVVPLNPRQTALLDVHNATKINDEILSLAESQNVIPEKNSVKGRLDQRVDQSRIVLVNAGDVKGLENLKHVLSVVEYEPQKISKIGKRKIADSYNINPDTTVASRESASPATPDVTNTYYEVPRTDQPKKLVTIPQYNSRPNQGSQKPLKIDSKSKSRDPEHIYRVTVSKAIKGKYSRTHSVITTTPSGNDSYPAKVSRRKKSRKRVTSKPAQQVESSSFTENTENYPKEFLKSGGLTRNENKNKSRRLSLQAKLPKYDIAPRPFSISRYSKESQEDNLEKINGKEIASDEIRSIGDRNIRRNTAKIDSGHSSGYRNSLPGLNKKLYERKDGEGSSTIRVNVKDGPLSTDVRKSLESDVNRASVPYEDSQISEENGSFEDKSSKSDVDRHSHKNSQIFVRNDSLEDEASVNHRESSKSDASRQKHKNSERKYSDRNGSFEDKSSKSDVDRHSHKNSQIFVRNDSLEDEASVDHRESSKSDASRQKHKNSERKYSDRNGSFEDESSTDHQPSSKSDADRHSPYKNSQIFERDDSLEDEAPTDHRESSKSDASRATYKNSERKYSDRNGSFEDESSTDRQQFSRPDTVRLRHYKSPRRKFSEKDGSSEGGSSANESTNGNNRYTSGSDLGKSSEESSVISANSNSYESNKTPAVTVHSVNPIVSTLSPYTTSNLHSNNYVYYPPLLPTLAPTNQAEQNDAKIQENDKQDSREASDGVAEATNIANDKSGNLKKGRKYEIQGKSDEGHQTGNHDLQSHEYIRDSERVSKDVKDDSDGFTKDEDNYGQYAQKYDDRVEEDVATDGSHNNESHQSAKEGAASGDAGGKGGEGKFEKGGATERKQEHRESDDEKGEKGYKSWHEEEKADKGHHDKERHSNYFDEKDGAKKDHKEEGEYHQEHDEGEKGEKKAAFDENGKHQKGYNTKGQHFVHKKDEFEKRTEFFDEFHEDGDMENDGEHYHEHKMSKGGHYKEGHHNKDDHEEMHGKKGKYEKGGHYDDDKGHKVKEGKDSHYEHENMYGKKKNHHDGKKWMYKKGDGGNGADKKGH
ncbi:putative uncharacterized protein DDB_G0281733 [Bombus pascuorum]|uniref:putative uncharacterized protein DDB_G0281733 n=1 Tax=Bombus pascuorum TaxID=65598 RepID=UPI00298E26BA|nr:putative uncharacterized protein DDB_G0281733 [Bombus pascuorum]